MKKQSTTWSLVNHLERLGLHPVMPQLDVWTELSGYLADTLGDDTGVEFFLHHLRKQRLGFVYAPVIETVYEWAARTHRDILPFQGHIHTEANVRRAMLVYIAEQVMHQGYFTGLEDTLTVLIQHAPLPETLCQLLDAKFDQLEYSAWLAPLTGRMPRVDAWPALCDKLLERYDARDSDEFVMEGSRGQHWLTNHRVDLVLAAWLSGRSSKFFAASLYSQLPNVNMEKPDQATALLWLVALDYAKNKPARAEAPIVLQWMDQHFEYKAFIDEHRGIAQTLMGEDPVACSGLLSTMWNERHGVGGPRMEMDGLLQSE